MARRPAAKKRPAARAPARRARRPQELEVRIRMYRQGLGDCFLLTFGADAHILIDCGILAGTPRAKDRVREVALDIERETGGRLKALVVTHEHWDHVSGFAHARDVFERFRIGETWVAWTEDPAQDLIAEKRALAVRFGVLTRAARRLALSPDPEDAMRGAGLAESLAFLGDGPAESGGEMGDGTGQFLPAFSPMTDEAMSWATHADRNPRYWSPGDIIERDWMPGVRVHVLGPPKDKKALKRMGGEIGTDMYGVAFGLTGEELGFGYALSEGAEASGREAGLPFDPALQWRDEGEWLKQFDKEFRAEYRSERWRRVDHDWLAVAEGLALQLDNAINNTSLVLAFELGAGADVLLFVGDAQIGNWKSWTEGAADLLRRTVFYKVGHHGSHNATLKEGGLEAMASPCLVAAIPVDERAAKAKRPHPWMMPADHLYDELRKRTRGRILRADQAAPKRGDPVPPEGTKASWAAFVRAVEDNGIWVEYRYSRCEGR